MHFVSGTIFNASEVNRSRLWGLAENYLHVGQRAFRVTEFHDRISTLDKASSEPSIVLSMCVLDEVSSKTNILITALKVLSYATIILPLLAFAIKLHYRYTYSFLFLPPSQHSFLREQIASFMTQHSEREISKGRIPLSFLKKIRSAEHSEYPVVLKRYQELLEKRCTDFDGPKYYYYIDSDGGKFSEMILALQYVREHQPETFQKDKQQLQDKFEDIYCGLHQIFHERPKPIFDPKDECYPPEFYSFLVTLQEFERLLKEPISEKQQTAV